MSLLQRLKNLWKLSEFRPMELGEHKELRGGDIVAPLLKRKEQDLATIIDSRKPLDIFPNHPDLDYDETN